MVAVLEVIRVRTLLGVRRCYPDALANLGMLYTDAGQIMAEQRNSNVVSGMQSIHVSKAIDQLNTGFKSCIIDEASSQNSRNYCISEFVHVVHAQKPESGENKRSVSKAIDQLNTGCEGVFWVA
ncbi:uncharacterized protein A4U43_C10F11640 [Asparagus officinalis]|uniref:Uncharacterized protein n=1 Tax=Asparagus officinalis TaxID=4686 RepID=A0A5P1E257_ASPOF|nr:uncharacterized protein A4U43_C10F11640 [Asparagus officinalis]